MPSKTSENIDPDNAKITSEQRPFTVIVEGNIGSGEILLSQFTYLMQCLVEPRTSSYSSYRCSTVRLRWTKIFTSFSAEHIAFFDTF